MSVERNRAETVDRSRVLRILALAMLLASSIAGASAEEPAAEPPTEKAVAEPQAPRPFTAIEVPQELKRSNLELARVNALTEPSPEVETIAAELPSRIAVLEGMYADLDETNLDHRTRRQLDDDRQTWQTLQSDLVE